MSQTTTIDITRRIDGVGLQPEEFGVKDGFLGRELVGVEKQKTTLVRSIREGCKVEIGGS